MSAREPSAAILILAALLLAAPGLAQDASLGLRDAPLPPADPSQPAVSPAPAGEPMKVIPNSFSEAVGTWDISLQGSNNRCTLVLSSENSSNGRLVRFPAGCRRALPALARTAGWIFADGGIRLIDKDIRPLLQFQASQDRSSLTAKAEGGATYALVPLQTMAMLPPAPDATATDPSATPAAAPAAAANPDPVTAAIATPAAGHAPETPTGTIRMSNREIPGSQPVLPSGALMPSQAAATAPEAKPAQQALARPAAPSATGIAPTPGIYALDRFQEKDVCRLELEASKVAAKGGSDALSAARILPGCRDSGITVFDPVSWRFANGHMTLKAKRGHAVNLVPTGEGSWRRDPDVGTTFVLRKVER